MAWIVHVSFSFLSTVTFGIITNVPRRALVACGITGAVGWMIYWLTKDCATGATFANFLGAVGIGTASVYFSRKLKMPMIIFNIPSLVPLVPGGPAYQAVRSIVLGDYLAGLNFALNVAFTAGALAAGFVVTSILERIVKQIMQTKTFYKQKN
ncbi:threonine/serine exporter family protein [Enterococcus faecalis]